MTALLVNAAWPHTVDVAAASATVLGNGGQGIGFPDSPRLFPDPFLSTERLLTGTPVPLAGPCVLGLGLRHPATVASGLRTLADGHPGRVFAVLARGESAVRNERLPTLGLAGYVQALDRVRELIGGSGEALTLLAAASGPRTVAAAATSIGGVLIDAGADPDVVARAVRVARSTDTALPCWLFLRVGVTTSAGHRGELTTGLLGSCAARLAAAPEWYRIGDRDVSGVRALAEGHDYRRHGSPDAAAAEHPLAELVRERFFVTGDAAEVATRVRALLEPGIDGVVLAGALPGLAENLAPTIAAVSAAIRSEDPS
jgi:alkanesulfonate monooxygenase SsuD/methylene tetrahydromethanopterin reductase-like flavin-dependent oxidoreductase (luciferase family)